MKRAIKAGVAVAFFVTALVCFFCGAEAACVLTISAPGWLLLGSITCDEEEEPQ
jgi:hypothetical protein